MRVHLHVSVFSIVNTTALGDPQMRQSLEGETADTEDPWKERILTDGGIAYMKD